MAKFSVDSDLVRKLADLLTETGLTEVEITDGDKTMRVARHGNQRLTVGSVAELQADPMTAPTSEPKPEEGIVSDQSDILTSPMVGTVFISPQPGADPFVREGDKVSEGQILLIIEAMKVMNPIPAERSGVVRSVLIEDGQPVEFGEALLVIE